MSHSPGLTALLRELSPLLHPGVYGFAALGSATRIAEEDIVVSVREPEGTTVIVERGVAERHALSPLFWCRWITLMVHSDLAAIGLTAAVATALAAEGIACNVVAGLRHDHVFVPVDRARDAMTVLARLQAEAARESGV